MMCAGLWADEFQIGQDVYNSGDYEESYRIWLPLAEAGDERAQFAVGTLFFEGRGVDLDLERSTQWFRTAAELGFAPAQFNLGNAYKHAHGVRQDDKLANAWWLKAAEQEFAPAQFNLGTQYYFGRGMEKNEEEALLWYRRAADNGHVRAKALFASDQTPLVSASTSDPTPSTTSAEDDHEWIKHEPPAYFTLQLMATPNEESAQSLGI